MSCNTCAHQAEQSLKAVGVPASNTQAVWTMTWQHLDRCQCGAWVSPSSGVCKNARCSMLGKKVAQPRGWPPQGVRFTTQKSLVGQQTSAAPARPPVAAPPVRTPAGGAALPPVPVQAVPAVATAPVTAPIQPPQPPQRKRRKKPKKARPLTPLPVVHDERTGKKGAIPAGLDLLSAGKSQKWQDISLGALWGNYEYGGDLVGVTRALPSTGGAYVAGKRFKADSGVGARQGRDTSKATTTGAILPAMADMMANAKSQDIAQEGTMTLWYGEAADGNGSQFAAVYDTSTNEAACFVPGCRGSTSGEPCSHQLGAIAAALHGQDENGAFATQFRDALTDHARAKNVESAVTAGDCAYVLLKEQAPQIITFGSLVALSDAQTTFAKLAVAPPAKKKKTRPGSQVAKHLGKPKPPETSSSARPKAKHDPDFVATPQMQRTLRMVGAGLRMGYSGNNTGMTGRAFGLYGPPGTGKNTVAEEAAAALKMPYREIDLGRGADLQGLLGEVVLEPDGVGGTRSVAKLGPLGKALVDGEVVALNEIIHTDPDSQTFLHQVVQEGVIQLHNPEGADAEYIVHPSSVLFTTWNPKGGEQDRPGEALYSRLFTAKMDYPTPEEETDMLLGWSQGQGLPDVDETDAKTVVDFIHDIRSLADQGGVDVSPSFRDAQKFISMWAMTGDSGIAVEQLRGLASQAEDHELQWSEVQALFGRHFNS